jgi:hypothetical protein
MSIGFCSTLPTLNFNIRPVFIGENRCEQLVNNKEYVVLVSACHLSYKLDSFSERSGHSIRLVWRCGRSVHSLILNCLRLIIYNCSTRVTGFFFGHPEAFFWQAPILVIKRQTGRGVAFA